MAKRMLEIEGVCEIEARKWGGGVRYVWVSVVALLWSQK